MTITTHRVFTLSRRDLPLGLALCCGVLVAPLAAAQQDDPASAWPVFPAPSQAPGDDTARFYGTWKAQFEANGQTVTMISVHDARGYRNFLVANNGQVPAGNGSFAAANGRYTAGAPKPNDGGTYHFIDSETAVCTNSAGQTVTWRRTGKPVDANTAAMALTGYRPPTSRPGTLDKR